MKNKIKKIIPLILCFVMVIGNCIVADAKVITLNPLVVGNTYDFSYEIIGSDGTLVDLNGSFNLLSATDNVYLVPSVVNVDNNSQIFVVTLVSTGRFNYIPNYLCEYQYPEETNIRTYTSSDCGKTQEAASYKVNGETIYFAVSGYATSPNLNRSVTFTNIYGSPSSYMTVDYDSYVRYSKRGDIAVPCVFFENDFQFDDGKAFEYDLQPSAEIEPPKNLSIYRGYSNADKQYKFQMQWDKPADTDLNVEVMYNIHWKEGTGSALGFGTHVYKKYQHLVYEDEHSAQSNKLQYLEDDLLKGYFASQEMGVPSVYNIDEIYVRFAKEVDGVIRYSLWRKIDYMNLDEGNGFDSTEDDFKAESSTGAFDTSDNWIDQSVQNGEIVNGSEKEDAKAPGLDANGDNITNVDKPIVNPDSWDGQFEGVFSQFTNAIKSAFSFVGEFPAMLSEFFGFLPASVLGCISIGLVMVVVLRFLGR